MAELGALFLGTSGWSYQHWRERVYPVGLSPDDWLAFYAEHFSSVELNTTFYGLPKPSAVEDWRETVPEDFVFAAKISRYLSHLKRLKDPDEGWDNFLDAIEPLQGKLGPLLLQLRPNFEFGDANLERLSDFLDLARPAGYRLAVEFRHASWNREETFSLLEQAKAALCVAEGPRGEIPRFTREVTADWVYLRFHGPAETLYGGSYPASFLQRWADRITSWLHEGLDVYGYFNNDYEGYAFFNARELLGLCRERIG